MSHGAEIWCIRHVIPPGQTWCTVCGGEDLRLVEEEARAAAEAAEAEARAPDPTPEEIADEIARLPRIKAESGDGGLVPVGYIGGPGTEGHLPCDGRAVGTKAYPELYAALGTRYGSVLAPGPTGEPRVVAFRIPDLRGRAI